MSSALFVISIATSRVRMHVHDIKWCICHTGHCVVLLTVDENSKQEMPILWRYLVLTVIQVWTYFYYEDRAGALYVLRLLCCT